MFAGTAPGGLFRSEDWGASWSGIEAINDHEFRAFWQGIPGGHSPVHSIIIDPADGKRMYISSSGGGSYVTPDGGRRWVMFSHHAKAQTEEARVFISQIAAEVPPGWDPASISDFHHMELDSKNPGRLWGQAHWGVFRSDDGGRTWEDVTHMNEPNGLPSFHGFPITVTKREPDAAFVVPLEMGTDNLRTVPGQFTVYRTRDAGTTWEPLTDGLPGPRRLPELLPRVDGHRRASERRRIRGHQQRTCLRQHRLRRLLGTAAGHTPSDPVPHVCGELMATLRLLVGTKKGAFIYTADEARSTWSLVGPMMGGWRVLHIVDDQRGDHHRLYAAATHDVWGPSVSKSNDGGQTWEQRSEGLGFPEDMGLKVDTVWSITAGHESEPGVVYAGTSPAGLFRSEDWGASWTANDAIIRHDYRAFWQPVAGGPATPDEQRVTMALHSIEIDPNDANHFYLTISGGASYETIDHGETWTGISVLTGKAPFESEAFIFQVKAGVPPDRDPAEAFDTHCLRMDTKNPNRLWGQTHTGVFKTDDNAETWQDVTSGLPSNHGFPVAISRRDPDAVFVVPLDVGGANFRVQPGQMTVYRTRDNGVTWQPLTDGLPGPHNYQSVYREGLDTDGLTPEGVYAGTSNGEVYASIDGGDHWERLPGTLPPVLSITCAVY